MTCSICCNTYTAIVRRGISCVECSFESCIKCMKTYFLSVYKEPCCMNCNTEFPLSFIQDNFSKSFCQHELRKHHQKMILDYEISLLPETALYLERRAQRKTGVVQDIKIIKKCGSDNCNGFLNSDWKCGTCANVVCSKCHNTLQPEHVCNPDDIETAKFINSSSKPCPKCAVPISKIDGCDLMFCTLCHVSFSWNSGEEVTPVYNHNPHYLEMMRSQNNGIVPRAPGDIPYRIPNWTNVNIFKFVQSDSDFRVNFVDNMIRTLWHFVDCNITRIPNDFMTNNRDLRISYIRNRIDEKSWVRHLQIREKKRNVALARKVVTERILDIVSPIFYAMIEENDVNDLPTKFDIFTSAFENYNNSIESIHKRYNMSIISHSDLIDMNIYYYSGRWF